MGFQRVGSAKLSRSGRALLIVLDGLPNTLFTSYLYIPRKQVEEILEDRIKETSVSLSVRSDREDD